MSDSARWAEMSGLPAERPIVDRSHPSGLPAERSDAGEASRPSFTIEDLQILADDDAVIAAEVEAEEEAGNAQMRKLGFSEESIAKVRGRPAEPRPTLAEVEAELAEIDKFRREQKIKYFRSESTQKREVELLELHAKLKAGDASTEERKESDNANISDGELPEALRKEWEKSGPNGLEDALRAVKFRTTMAFADLEDAGEGLRESFDALPDDAQTAIASGLADDAGKWPTATPAEVEEFVALPHGAELAKEWGDDAPRLLGRARREADAIMSRLTEQSKLKMHHWIAGRSAAELKGMVRALAARAARRL